MSLVNSDLRRDYASKTPLRTHTPTPVDRYPIASRSNSRLANRWSSKPEPMILFEQAHLKAHNKLVNLNLTVTRLQLVDNQS